MKTRFLLLLTIFLVGLGMRLVGLDKRPAGFTWDEAALGYNAYSLFKTGRDEYGKILPVVLKSFGDYKPGLYAYFAVPSIAVLGLNEFATRLPSAILGTLLIIVMYLLVKELFAIHYSLFTAVLLAISPWAIHFSRGAWEANLALFLTTLGVLLFVRQKHSWSALFLGLTFLSYQGAKLFTPLVIVSLLVIWRRQLDLRQLMKPLLVLLLLLSLILMGGSSQFGRLKVFSVFSYHRPDEAISEILRQDRQKQPNWLFGLFHSEAYDQLRGVVQRYTNYFSPYYLFFAGDWTSGRHAIPYYGYLHIPEILTVILGTIYLIKANTPGGKLIWAWLLLAPVPAALSRDLVSGVRSLPMIVPLVVVSGIGLSILWKRKSILCFYTLVLLYFLIYWADLYFTHAPNFTATDWLSAYEPALQLVKQNIPRYQRVVFTDKLGQPYIFSLFYLGINPREYQGQGRLKESAQGDVGLVESFGKFSFRPIFWPADRGLKSTLFVGGEYELPEKDLLGLPSLVRVGEIYYPNGSHALRLVGLQ